MAGRALAFWVALAGVMAWLGAPTAAAAPPPALRAHARSVPGAARARARASARGLPAAGRAAPPSARFTKP
jgi:hypothetical protein